MIEIARPIGHRLAVAPFLVIIFFGFIGAGEQAPGTAVIAGRVTIESFPEPVMVSVTRTRRCAVTRSRTDRPLSVMTAASKTFKLGW